MVSRCRVIGSRGALPANAAEFHGLRDARSSDLPALDRHVALYRALGGVVSDQLGRTYFNPLRPGAERLLDAFSVRYVFDDGGELPPRADFAG